MTDEAKVWWEDAQLSFENWFSERAVKPTRKIEIEIQRLVYLDAYVAGRRAEFKMPNDKITSGENRKGA